MRNQLYETRRKLIVALKKEGPLSIDELAKEMQITAVAVRKHLAEMEKDGLTTSYLERRPVGRPRHVYALTDQAENQFPTAYLQLAGDLLDGIKQLYGEEELRRVLALRVDRLVEEYSARLQGKPFAEKARELAKLRREAGLLVELEEKGDQFVLKEFNCSVYELAKKYHILCDGELEIFRRVLEAEVISTSSIARGDGCCHFLIRLRSRSREASVPALVID